MGKLTDKQERFCREYIIDLNATQAAIRTGYSEKTANQQGARLLVNVNILDRISELREKRETRTEAKGDKVILELAKIGFSNIQDYIKEGFEIDDIVNLEREKAAAIESIQVTTTTRGTGQDRQTEKTVKFKLYDKVKALDMLGKHHGIFEKDNEQRQPIIIPDLSPEQRKKLRDDFERTY